MKAFIILLALAVIADCSVRDKKTPIYRAVEALVPTLPALKKAALEQPAAKSGQLQPIINRGYTSFSQKTVVLVYNGVASDDVDDFMNYLDNAIGLPPQYRKKFNAALGLIEWADFKEFIDGNVVFSTGKGGDCKFVLIFAQNDGNGDIDWLIGDVQSTFTLAPDLLVYEASSRSILGFKRTKTIAVDIPKVLTKEELRTLSDFFQATIIERFGLTLGLIRNLR